VQDGRRSVKLKSKRGSVEKPERLKDRQRKERGDNTNLISAR
jgi:hypothetical protein